MIFDQKKNFEALVLGYIFFCLAGTCISLLCSFLHIKLTLLVHTFVKASGDIFHISLSTRLMLPFRFLSNALLV